MEKNKIPPGFVDTEYQCLFEGCENRALEAHCFDLELSMYPPHPYCFDHINAKNWNFCLVMGCSRWREGQVDHCSKHGGISFLNDEGIHPDIKSPG